MRKREKDRETEGERISVGRNLEWGTIDGILYISWRDQWEEAGRVRCYNARKDRLLGPDAVGSLVEEE